MCLRLEVELKASIMSYPFSFVRDFMKFLSLHIRNRSATREQYKLSIKLRVKSDINAFDIIAYFLWSFGSEKSSFFITGQIKNFFTPKRNFDQINKLIFNQIVC